MCLHVLITFIYFSYSATEEYDSETGPSKTPCKQMNKSLEFPKRDGSSNSKAHKQDSSKTQAAEESADMTIVTKCKTVRRRNIGLKPDEQLNIRSPIPVLPAPSQEKDTNKVTNSIQQIYQPNKVPRTYCTIQEFMAKQPIPSKFFAIALGKMAEAANRSIAAGNFKDSELAQAMKTVLQARFCLVCNNRSGTAVMGLLNTCMKIMDGLPAACAATWDLDQMKKLLTHAREINMRMQTAIGKLHEHKMLLEDNWDKCLQQIGQLEVKVTAQAVELIQARSQLNDRQKQVQEMERLKQKVVKLEGTLSTLKGKNAKIKQDLDTKKTR